MSLRTSLQKLIRRDPSTSLRERAAELRGTLSRRTVVAGSLAVAAPLPTIAATIVEAPAKPHPDADLLALGERWLQAQVAQDEAMEAWGIAWRQVYAVLITCPSDLFATREERRRVLGGWRWPTLLGVSLRHVALDWGDPRKPHGAGVDRRGAAHRHRPCGPDARPRRQDTRPDPALEGHAADR